MASDESVRVNPAPVFVCELPRFSLCRWAPALLLGSLSAAEGLTEEKSRKATTMIVATGTSATAAS